jgi:hypothetical protein
MAIVKKHQRKCSALTSNNTKCLRIAFHNSLFCKVHERTKPYDK